MLWVVSAWLACGYGYWRRKDATWKTAQWRTLISEFKLSHGQRCSWSWNVLKIQDWVIQRSWIFVRWGRDQSDRLQYCWEEVAIMLAPGMHMTKYWHVTNWYDKIIQDLLSRATCGDPWESTLTIYTTMYLLCFGLDRAIFREQVVGYSLKGTHIFHLS